MNSNYFGKGRNEIEISFINLLILMFIFRSTIPLLKYPFVLLYTIVIIYLIIFYNKRIVLTFFDFIRQYYLILFLLLLLAISFLFSSKIYLIVFKDVINSTIVLSIFFMLNILVNNRKDLSFFVSNFIYILLILSLIVSIIGLLDKFDIFSYRDFAQIKEVPEFSSNGSFYIDWNFAIIPSFFGIIAVFYFFRNNFHKLKILLYIILFSIFNLSIILSGSRRGLIVLLIFIVFLFIIKINSIKQRNRNFYFTNYASNCFIISLTILVLILVVFFTSASLRFKNNTLELLGSKDPNLVKRDITLNLYRYFSSVNYKMSYSDLHKKLWSEVFDPKDPDSGWGTNEHKTIFPLTGIGVDIVPRGSRGYMIDSSCNVGYYDGVDLSESYTFLFNTYAQLSDHFKASVYCYVSEFCEVDKVQIAIPSSIVNSGLVSGVLSSSYDLKNRGTWQKLGIEFDSNEGMVSVVLSIIKNNVKDFLDINGHIIFAYPQYEKNGAAITFYYPAKPVNEQKCLVRDDLIGAPMHLNPSSCKIMSSLNLIYPLLIFSANEYQDDPDPIRNWTSKFISEDTTYFPYKQHIEVNTTTNVFIGSRILRWTFALKLYKDEFNLKQKIFGGGFNFLNWYGYYFNNDKTRIDYPHNPFLSVLLYSGLFGLTLYVIFIFKVFLYYVKYYNEYKTFFLLFIITFFFSFFSAGNPFDPPVLGFFVILPYFIHHIHKKAVSESEVSS